MKQLLYILVFVGIWWKFSSKNEEISLGPGMFAPKPPQQAEAQSSESYSFNEYTITPLQEIHLRAKILARKNYYFGRESDLSPTDFVLGWGEMSDEKILQYIDISQSGRWYYWRVDEFPISRREIETHSANMHLIPANDQIEAVLDNARKGDIVELSGSLVRVEADDGWEWVSSLSRDDTGDGACELIFVRKIEVIEI